MAKATKSPPKPKPPTKMVVAAERKRKAKELREKRRQETLRKRKERRESMRNPDQLIADKGHGPPMPLLMAHAAAQDRMPGGEMTDTQERVMTLLRTISPAGITDPERLSTEEIVEWIQRPDWTSGVSERLEVLVQAIDAQALSTLMMLLGPDNTSNRIKMRATEVALKLTGRLVERQEHQHTIGLAEQLLSNANPVMPKQPDAEARIIDIDPVWNKD